MHIQGLMINTKIVYIKLNMMVLSLVPELPDVPILAGRPDF